MIRRPPRSTRTDTLFPYTTLFRSAVGVAIDVEGSFAGRRLVAKIADEDRPVVKTAVDLVVQGQLDVADAVAVHILGQLRIGIDLRNDERDSIVPVDVGNLDFGLQAVGDAEAPGNRSLIEVPVRILRLEQANQEGVEDLDTQEGEAIDLRMGILDRRLHDERALGREHTAELRYCLHLRPRRLLFRRLADRLLWR